MVAALSYLLPRVADPDGGLAVRCGQRPLSYRELAGAAAAVADSLASARRVGVWATSSVETVVAVVGALAAGAAVVPLNPRAGQRELRHILGDAEPDVVLHEPDAELPQAVRDHACAQVHASVAGGVGAVPGAEVSAETVALIVYTSGTTGPPKGVLLPYRSIATNLDALASAWRWTAGDVVAHALPLFHVHGLILGVLGPLRRGGTVQLLTRFSPATVADALRGPATVLFGVPTMYHRLATEAAADPAVAQALAGARLLVSGSAALTQVDHERIAATTGQRLVQRYGMTETLMNCAVRVDGDRRAGTVGPPLDGVEVKLVDDDGATIDARDGETIGEVAVRGPNLFLGYLNRADATAQAMRDGWFHTGDLATRAPDGHLQLVGRRSTDLIKTGGFKVGAGEIENALLEHPGVAEAAVTAAPDPDLGERIVAWIVPARQPHPGPEELSAWVADLLAPHKRPRDFHFLDQLPRNDMGKVMKHALPAPGAADHVLHD